MCGLLFGAINAVPAQAASTTASSAIGDQAPLWIAASPAYWDTRMVAALATAMGGCVHHCSHLWITRDGGATWRDHPLGFAAAHLAIQGHGSQRESLVTASQSGVLRSDDDGRTWHVIGPSGMPVVSPSGAIEVAVPGGTDYVVDAHGRHDVAGSGRAVEDLVFASAQYSSWLAATDRTKGNDVVLRCDMQLHCAGGAPLAGDHSADVTLTVANRERDIIARTTTGLYRSTDAGRSFLPVNLPTAKESAYTTVAAADVEPSNDGEVLYVALLRVLRTGADGGGSTEGGIYSSANGGVTWRAVSSGSPLDGGATAVARAADGRILAGYVNAQGHAGLLCYEDDKTGWRATCSRSVPACATCDAGNDGTGAGAEGTIVEGSGDTGPGAQSTDAASAPVGGGTASSALHAGAAKVDDTGGLPAISVAALGIGLAVAVLALPVSTRRRRSP